MVSRQVKRSADAAERYLAQFDAFAANGARGAPPWLREIRTAALARFAELGFPTTHEEEWRFTSVAPIAATPFTLPARRAGPAASRVAPLFLPVESACRLV
jgi:Fe-S cluster assembly protein SufD